MGYLLTVERVHQTIRFHTRLLETPHGKAPDSQKQAPDPAYRSDDTPRQQAPDAGWEADRAQGTDKAR